MMRYLYILLFVWGVCADLSAQKFYVYQSQGNVTVRSGRTSTPVKIRQLIYGNQTLDLPANSKIKLFAPQTQRFYMLNGKKNGVVNKILPTDKRSIEEISKTYFSYVCHQLFGGKPIDGMATTTAGQYRDFCDVDTCTKTSCSENHPMPAPGDWKYYVYQIYGDVSICKGDTLTPIEPRMELRSDDVLHISENSIVRLFDSYNSQLLLVRTSLVDTVGKIVKADAVEKLNLSEDVFGYVCRQVFGDEPIDQPQPVQQSDDLGE